MWLKFMSKLRVFFWKIDEDKGKGSSLSSKKTVSERLNEEVLWKSYISRRASSAYLFPVFT